MSVLADPDQSDVRGRAAQFPGEGRDPLFRAVHKMHRHERRDLLHKALLQVFSEACGVFRGQIPVLVQMEHLHPVPRDILLPRQGVKRLKLGRAGGQHDPRAPLPGDHLPQNLRDMRGRALSQCLAAVCDPDLHHFSLLMSLMLLSYGIVPRLSRKQNRFPAVCVLTRTILLFRQICAR